MSTVSQSAASVPPEPLQKRHPLRLPLMIIGVLLVLAGALYFWLTGGRYMSTDDAYVQAAQAAIGCNVSGEVAMVAVHDNQLVHRGELLFQLDEQPFKIAVAEAEAKLGTAGLQIAAGKAGYRQQLAALRSAQDTLAYQQREYDRQQRLLSTGIASQAQFDQARHALEAARQQVDSAKQQAGSVLALLGGNPDIDANLHPSVLQAQAALDRAKLDLSYTSVTAPDDGIVTRVEQLQVGNHVSAANPVFALISTRDVWIEANFKEDQLTHLRPGQPATIKFDTYPGKDFKARVVSVAPGTGSQFSALPAENATGNWVKVVQRLPVRLELEPGQTDAPLPTGLSATVDVDTGYSRHLFADDQASPKS